MFDKLKNIFKKKPKPSIITPKTIKIMPNMEQGKDFYEQRRKERGLDDIENTRLKTEKEQADAFAVSLEIFKKHQQDKSVALQEFYQQRKKERGLD